MASNELKSLNNIFDGKFLRIPDYQRGYAWEENQLKDFWEDLINLEDNHMHYTGVLTLEKVTKDMKDERIEFWKQDIGAYESDESYYIVDGQQRITTSIIFLQVFFELFEEKNIEWVGDNKVIFLKEKYLFSTTRSGYNKYFFGYTADNPSYEFLKTTIFGEASSTDDNKETLYTANLEYAKDFFKEKLKDVSDEELENLFKKLTYSFKYNLYEIADDMDVFVAFETMNNRGKKLSNLELLKNRLIYLSTKLKDDDKRILRRDINESWKTIYEYLGKNKDNILNDDTFLKNHWIMYHDYSRKKGNDYIVDLLEDRYVVKKVIDDTLKIEDIRDYIMSLKKSVVHWYYLFNPSEAIYDTKIKFLLDKLHRLGYGAFLPLLMAIFSRDDEYVLDDIVGLLTIMEKYIFLVFKISQRRSNTGDSEFYGYARQYYLGKTSINDMIGIYNEEENKFTGINWWLASYFDFSQFENYMKEKFSKRDGYYSWNGLNYFLFEYELSLKGKNYENKINWYEYSNRKSDYVSIEHILPQNPEEECWKKLYSEYTENELENICNSLGNLTPLSVSKNSKLQNYCFEIKKKGKDDQMVGYQNGSYSEQEINQIEGEWTAVEIEKRGIKLLEFMSKNWGVDELSSDDIKKKYLFLP